MPEKRCVFITGSTGFIGSALISKLVERGHRVRALVRAGSESKLPAGCEAVPGNALKPETYSAQIAPAEAFVHLIGTHHPNPAKGVEFREVDLVSVRAGASAARAAAVKHFVYLSVAQPAPIMKDYIEVRAEGERMVREMCEAIGASATFVRPWYVLGPGRRWPFFLVPMYWLLERIPGTRERAIRLGLVTREQMVAAITSAIENPPAGVQILETAQIRKAK